MSHTAVDSPNAPRPEDQLIISVANAMARAERNYAREGSGPGSRFEGQLLEDVQARVAVAMVRAAVAQERWNEQAAGGEFKNRFTVFPDTGIVELNCGHCPGGLTLQGRADTWEIGYHPSLDNLVKQAREHNRAKHNEEPS